MICGKGPVNTTEQRSASVGRPGGVESNPCYASASRTPSGNMYDGTTMEPSPVACPACGHPNLPGKRFCGGCGQPMPTACLSCAAVNPPGDRFCQDRGTPLTPAASHAAPSESIAPPAAPASPVSITSTISGTAPPQEERRLVTSLFCDLVGFTPMSEQLDPEEVRDIQADYFDRMAKQIERFGGVVEKYAGDAVLALFGAPIAHEDDAERAVLGALGMQAAIEPVAAAARSRWSVDLSIRVGVNTGEVVSCVRKQRSTHLRPSDKASRGHSARWPCTRHVSTSRSASSGTLRRPGHRGPMMCGEAERAMAAGRYGGGRPSYKAGLCGGSWSIDYSLVSRWKYIDWIPTRPGPVKRLKTSCPPPPKMPVRSPMTLMSMSTLSSR